MPDKRESSRVVAVWALVSGGLVGAAVALLLAPHSGRALRQQLRGFARRTKEQGHGVAERASQALHQAVDKGGEFIKDEEAVLAKDRS